MYYRFENGSKWRCKCYSRAIAKYFIFWFSWNSTWTPFFNWTTYRSRASCCLSFQVIRQTTTKCSGKGEYICDLTCSDYINLLRFLNHQITILFSWEKNSEKVIVQFSEKVGHAVHDAVTGCPKEKLDSWEDDGSMIVVLQAVAGLEKTTST